MQPNDTGYFFCLFFSALCRRKELVECRQSLLEEMPIEQSYEQIILLHKNIYSIKFSLVSCIYYENKVLCFREEVNCEAIKMPLYEGLGLTSEKHAVVIDIGAAFTKCGYAGSNRDLSSLI
jgi:hypothetical protein